MNILVREMNPVTSFSTSERLAEILESYIGGRSAVIQSERIISPFHLQSPLYTRDLPGAGASKWVTSLTFVTLITRSYCEGRIPATSPWHAHKTAGWAGFAFLALRHSSRVNCLLGGFRRKHQRLSLALVPSPSPKVGNHVPWKCFHLFNK